MNNQLPNINNQISSNNQAPITKQTGFGKLIIGYWVLFGVWCLVIGVSGVYAQEKIVAIVNSDIITQKDLNDFINFTRIQMSKEYQGKELETKIQSMKLDLLNKLVDDRLIMQEARKNKLAIDENRIKGEIEELKVRYGSDAAFQRALSRQGLTQADLENRLKEQLLMRNIIEIKVRRRIVVRPEEVTAFYNKNTEEFTARTQRKFQSLSTTDAALAGQAYNDLKNGVDFDEVAKKYSLAANTLTAKQGGELRKEIEDTVFKLNSGEISAPLEVEGTYYIFKLIQIIPPRQQALPEVQEMIFAFLFEKKMQEELSIWLDELRKNSYIKIVEK